MYVILIVQYLIVLGSRRCRKMTTQQLQAEKELAAQRLWQAFQESATAVAHLFRGERAGFASFHESASAVTQLYRGMIYHTRLTKASVTNYCSIEFMDCFHSSPFCSLSLSLSLTHTHTHSYSLTPSLAIHSSYPLPSSLFPYFPSLPPYL